MSEKTMRYTFAPIAAGDTNSRLRPISETKGETMVLLVRVDPTEGLAGHIPNTLGQPLCKIRLNRSFWQIKESPVDEARLCHRCAVM